MDSPHNFFDGQSPDLRNIKFNFLYFRVLKEHMKHIVGYKQADQLSKSTSEKKNVKCCKRKKIDSNKGVASNKKRNSSINQNDNAIFVAVIVLLLARIDNAILKTLWKNAFLAGLTQKTKAKNFHCGFASFEKQQPHVLQLKRRHKMIFLFMRLLF